MFSQSGTDDDSSQNQNIKALVQNINTNSFRYMYSQLSLYLTIMGKKKKINLFCVTLSWL